MTSHKRCQQNNIVLQITNKQSIIAINKPLKLTIKTTKTS